MAAPLHPAHIGGRYVLLDMLGAGGMGEVYRAFDPLTRQSVALKRLTANPIHLQSNATALKHSSRIALAHEFRMLSGLRHPNLTPVLDYGFDWGGPFFITELIDSPRTLPQAGLLLSLEGQVRLLAACLHALDSLHQCGILHRNLKPTNTLVTAAGDLKLVDFGLALTAQEIKRRPETRNALTYLAPELLATTDASAQSDLYAVGMMAYEMLTGQLPFDLTDKNRLMVEAMTIQPDFDPIPAALRPFIQSLLAKSPEGRYASVEAALTALADHTGIAIPVTDTPQQDTTPPFIPLVGRETEFETLRAALEPTLRRRRGSVWLIGGDSGVGKSRLMDELAVHALAGGAITLRGEIFEYKGLPYQLWREALRPLVLITKLTDAEASILKSIIPDIALLIGREVPDAPPVEGMDYDAGMVSAIVGLITRQTNPVVLLFEDIQWTLESMNALCALLPHTETNAIFIAATHQPDLRPTLVDQLSTANRLHLTSLESAGVDRLVSTLLRTPASTLTPLLLADSGGNAFAVIETLHALTVQVGGRDALRASVPTLNTLPVTAAQAIKSRISQLPAPAQALLTLAAIDGCKVTFEFLRAALSLQPLLPPDWTLERWLNVCASHAILEVVGRNWRFRHDKLRLEVLSTLSPETRQGLHRLAAEAWQSVAKTIGEDALIDTLFYHWHLAGEINRTLEIGMKLSAQLGQHGWHSESREMLNRLLEQVKEEVSPRRIELVAHIGDTLMNGNHPDQALTYYDEAARLAGQLATPTLIARAAYSQARAYLRIGRLDDAEHAAEACRATHAAAANLAGLSSAMTLLGLIADKRGDLTHARDAHGQAVSYARQSQNSYRLCVALADFGSLTLDSGDLARAQDILNEGLTLARTEEIEKLEAIMNIALSHIALAENRYIGAIDHLNHALAISQALATPDMLLKTIEMLALVHLWRGDDASAAHYVRHALALAPQNIVARLVRMHLLLIHEGAAAAASDAHALVLHAHATRDHLLLACAVMEVACVRLHQGVTPDSAHLFKDVRDIAQTRQISRHWQHFLNPHFIQTAPLSQPTPPQPNSTTPPIEKLFAAAVSLLGST